MNIVWSGILAVRSSLQNLLHGPLAAPQAVALSSAACSPAWLKSLVAQ